jgi:hypothetical protein
MKGGWKDTAGRHLVDLGYAEDAASKMVEDAHEAWKESQKKE